MSLPTTIDDSACCAPGATPALSRDEADRVARVFKAIGDPARVMLLSLIARSPDREACICNLTTPVGLSQGTVSHHMKILADAGLVRREQRGKWAYFAVDDDALGAAASTLRSM